MRFHLRGPIQPEDDTVLGGDATGKTDADATCLFLDMLEKTPELQREDSKMACIPGHAAQMKALILVFVRIS